MNISNVIFDRRPVSHPLGRLRGWGQKVKFKIFQNMVMLHIKLKGFTNAAACYQIFCLQTPTPPRLGVNYFEKVINYIQLHWKLFN